MCSVALYLFTRQHLPIHAEMKHLKLSIYIKQRLQFYFNNCSGGVETEADMKWGMEFSSKFYPTTSLTFNKTCCCCYFLSLPRALPPALSLTLNCDKSKTFPNQL